jgi:hypothetical protein
MLPHSPKLRRRGKRDGLDIDYQVDISDVRQIADVHNSLMRDGTGKIFMYARGDISYEDAVAVAGAGTVFHYIDKNLNLYDYAFVLDGGVSVKPKRTPDPEYAKSIKNPNFARNMKYKKWITAFMKHLIAYKLDKLEGIYADRFTDVINKIGIGYELDKSDYTYKNIEYIKNMLVST